LPWLKTEEGRLIGRQAGWQAGKQTGWQKASARTCDGMKINRHWKRQAGQDGMPGDKKEAEGLMHTFGVDWQIFLKERS
jgi:hypothetical protein